MCFAMPASSARTRGRNISHPPFTAAQINPRNLCRTILHPNKFTLCENLVTRLLQRAYLRFCKSLNSFAILSGNLSILSHTDLISDLINSPVNLLSLIIKSPNVMTNASIKAPLCLLILSISLSPVPASPIFAKLSPLNKPFYSPGLPLFHFPYFLFLLSLYKNINIFQ